MRRVDVQEGTLGEVAGLVQDPDQRPVMDQLPPEAAQQMEAAIEAVEALPLVKAIMRPGLAPLVGGFGIAVIALLFAAGAMLSHAELGLVLFPTVIAVVGLIVGIRGLVTLIRS